MRRRRYAFAAVLAAMLGFWALPVVEFDEPFSAVVLDRRGQLLDAAIAADEQWRFPRSGPVPEKFRIAIQSGEDRRFELHPGVDPLAIARALWLNVSSGEIVSGASTLTMQVVRLSRRGKSRTYVEKLVEMTLALRLEWAVTKEEVLALYAAHAPFGGNVVGLEAAAWRYFGRAPARLSWGETALLAVLPKSPALIHPGRNRERLRNRRDHLIDGLIEAGALDPSTGSLAKAEPLPTAPVPLPRLTPHLLARIRMGQPKGQIKTSIDRDLQMRATEVLSRHHEVLAGNRVQNAAALILDVGTGEALAYVGNVGDLDANIHGSHVDVIQAPRSTGSILKPLLFAAALDAGEILPAQLLPDIPTRIGSFAPENFNHAFSGAVSASRALARSLNVPAVHLLESYGVDRFYGLLKRLGMTTLHRDASGYGLTLIVGGAEGTLWEITGIYAGLARLVVSDGATAALLAPTFMLRASDDGGPDDPASLVLIGPGAAWLTLQAMLDVHRPGAERAWRSFTSRRQVAWKTGTSFGFRDGWAVGVTPRFALGVWAGNADGEGRPGLTGFAAAAPILFDLLDLLTTGDWFAEPYGDTMQVRACAHSGMRAGPFYRQTVLMTAPRSGLRADTCPYCRLVHCDEKCRFQVHGDCQPISRIRAQQFFVLPPAMEWFYRRYHADYRPLPPFREDCLVALGGERPASLSCMYPRAGAEIYVPLELNGERGRAVFEAAHRQSKATIYWHLDAEYQGLTRGLHQMALAPAPGRHVLTLVDQRGERLQQRFTVLDKD